MPKYGRFEQIRDKAWNVNQEVPRLNTWSDLDENNLDFKDPLVINNKQIKDSADPDKNIYGLKIAYFPVTEKIIGTDTLIG